ncbi:GYD domain-containing protein [Micromonospora sp. 15K316]|uniref:GYD domain-containing protein n=1 Tax=Micromonospora sp. 15K316 TaxID=2530376 RepID=UPI001047734A|nr:GYD domain-containing protein [Micromonospora sp. 15K316]TDC38359.1 GYD domain-containing protein [Micromonospora sp. 15K316]
MAKFLLWSTFTLDGIKGLMKDGGSKRAEVATKAIEDLGGRVESLSFGLGEYDTYVVCELPDHKTAAALAIAIRAAGGVDTRVTPLLTPEEVDEATRQQLKYQAPGA